MYPLFSKPRGARSHRHEHHTASDHEYLHDITLADAIAFHVGLVFAHDYCDVSVCVSEQSDRVSSECDENFQFQNGDRRFFATCVFGFFGRWEYVSR